MASQAAVANSASFQQDSALVARYAADRRGRGMSVSSQTSDTSVSEEETAYSSGYGSGVATPVPRPKPTTIEPAPTKPHKYVRREGVTVPATERSPLLERNALTRRGGDDQARDQEWTWWDELKVLGSYVLPVYGYVPPLPFFESVSSEFVMQDPPPRILSQHRLGRVNRPYFYRGTRRLFSRQYDGGCHRFFNRPRFCKCTRYPHAQCMDEWKSATCGALVAKDALACYSIVIRKFAFFFLLSLSYCQPGRLMNPRTCPADLGSVVQCRTFVISA